MNDVLVVGAGPAGAVAATVLARAGARVHLVDRADFPRPKLCGDTINPGTVAALRRLGLLAGEGDGIRVPGMTVTGHTGRSGGSGVLVEARYPHGQWGIAVGRDRLDWSLLQQAIAAGVSFDPGVTVTEAVVDHASGVALVTGARVARRGTAQALRARVTIAADGRRSRIAFGLGLSRHPAGPRRWAVGCYFEQVSGPPTMGEMHIRLAHYIGVAPTPRGLVNACLVAPAPIPGLRDPAALLIRTLVADPILGSRFSAARAVSPAVVLGPLAVERTGRSVDGLLLAGDAAGFIDPLTGDGLRFAVGGGELAAASALRALEHGWHRVHEEHARASRRHFESKRRFNRMLRLLVSSPAAVIGAQFGARWAPAVVRGIVMHAGDCALARCEDNSAPELSPRRVPASR
jgi:flavin-dependent dehydrogenase